VGELARGQGGEEAVEAADELVAGLGVGAGPGDLQGDEAQDVGEQGVDGADHGLVGEPGRAQHAVDRLAQPQAVRAQARLLDREGDHGGVGEQVGADVPADRGQLLGPVRRRVRVELEAGGVPRRRHRPGLDLVRRGLDLSVLLVPILLLPAAVGRRDAPVLRAATFVGAASVLLSLIGFLRWVFVVPPLAAAYVAGDPTTQAAVAAAWTAQHQFGGALLGEHLGQLLAIGWSVTVSVLILRTGMLARWAGWMGLVAGALYLANQGDILSTAIPGFPVWDLGGLLGSTLWGAWVLALGVAVLRGQPDHLPPAPQWPMSRPPASTSPLS
jgi:hypothetical protein